MDLIWIITRTDGEYGHSVLDDDPITATVEDAQAAFIDAVRNSPGSSTGYDISLEAIPTEPDQMVSWGRFEGHHDIVLTCRQVSSGLRTAKLQERRAELELQLAQINQQLAEVNNEAARIDEELNAPGTTADMVTAAEAAVKAHADTKTIHSWCRTRRVKAVKRSGAWDIDPESLAAHLDYTDAVVTAFLSVGGREWRRFDRHRVYFDDEVWQEWSGLVFTIHDGGRPNSAALDGRPIVDSNGGTGKLTWAISSRIYFDAAEHTLVLPGTPALAWHLPAFWGDGDRAEITIDLASRIAAGAAARTGLDFGTPISIRIGHGSHDLALAIPVTARPLEAS